VIAMLPGRERRSMSTSQQTGIFSVKHGLSSSSATPVPGTMGARIESSRHDSSSPNLSHTETTRPEARPAALSSRPPLPAGTPLLNKCSSLPPHTSPFQKLPSPFLVAPAFADCGGRGPRGLQGAWQR
jgi:hypothetical protein